MPRRLFTSETETEGQRDKQSETNTESSRAEIRAEEH